MKNLALIGTMMLLLGSSMNVKANHYGSQLVIHSESRSPILVELDQRVTGPPEPVHVIDGIRPGRHYIRIYKVERPRWGWGQPIKRMVHQGRITARQGHVIHYEMGRRGLIVLGSHPIHQGHGPMPTCHYGGCGPIGYGGPHGNGHGNGHGSGGHQGYGGGYQGYGYGSGQGQGYGYGSGYGGYNNGSCATGHNSYGYENGYGWYNGYRSPMSDGAFRTLQGRLNDQITDYQKVSYLKKLKQDDYLSTDQVGRILRSMSFDAQKYEAAKVLLPKTVDPDQYETLTREFTFENYKKDVEGLAKSAEKYKKEK